MEHSTTRSGSYAAIAACVGFAFGLASCFAIAFFFIMLGCPEPRGQACQDAVDLAGSITMVWYLFAFPVSAVSGIVTYRITRNGSTSLRLKIADSLIGRIVIYWAAMAVVLVSLLIAAIVWMVTSYQAHMKCPVESAYECHEAGPVNIAFGVLIVISSLTIMIGAIVAAYRLTRRPIGP